MMSYGRWKRVDGKWKIDNWYKKSPKFRIDVILYLGLFLESTLSVLSF